jgi:hypothetical protein
MDESSGLDAAGPLLPQKKWRLVELRKQSAVQVGRAKQRAEEKRQRRASKLMENQRKQQSRGRATE